MKTIGNTTIKGSNTVPVVTTAVEKPKKSGKKADGTEGVESGKV